MTTAADGSKSEVRTSYALVSGVTPTSDYLIETCDQVQTPAPAGCTPPMCVETGDPVPITKCSWNHGNGSFTADGKLVIFCSIASTNTNAAGTVTSSSDFRYGAIRVHVR